MLIKFLAVNAVDAHIDRRVEEHARAVVHFYKATGRFAGTEARDFILTLGTVVRVFYFRVPFLVVKSFSENRFVKVFLEC